ncbi:YggS family pyridoxal phosphate-dependent enzyme [Candidatus Pelagibacter sp.]|nr:YggS family pyridoxal phosphate-dependent enzyme [Candidatus Pelagibacter sp.]
MKKWTSIKNDFKDIKLHMIGKLQTNKVKYVVPLFDYIHSVDSLKLAEKISKQQVKNNKIMKLFIQINIGNENQKSGILIDQLDNFYNKCTNDLGLNVIGLMCLPPNDNKSQIYFSKMKELAKKLQLKDISMGMSNDYLEAINYQSTYLRIGSKIFGERT